MSKKKPGCTSTPSWARSVVAHSSSLHVAGTRRIADQPPSAGSNVHGDDAESVRTADGLQNRVGLDHVSFGCETRADLEKWAAKLDELGIDHGGIKDAAYGSGLSFRDPDGIALEFFAPPA